tara:strand:+ start:232 stop:900 length:669 start_codon:yes stop_codon:yes gene_type:complete
MEKDTISEISNDLKAKRDALMLCHSELKAESDQYAKAIIILSLLTGGFESCKIKLGWNSNEVALVPIIMSSVIASVSALMKFRDFNTKLEVLVQSISLLTNTLTKCRNHTEIDHDILVEYYNSLEKLEQSMYPHLRRRFLMMSHKNLLGIYKKEQEYFENIKKVNAGEKINISFTDDSDSSDNESIKKTKSDDAEDVGYTPHTSTENVLDTITEEELIKATL